MKLQDKVVLITGGGTGIGREIARLFAQNGAKVIICGRRERELSATADGILAQGLFCAYFTCDISSEDRVKDMFMRIGEEFAGLDILVNNASVVGQIAPVDQLDISQWEEALHINLTGTVICCREAMRIMKAQNGGNIINVSSNVGKRGSRNRSPYVCSKWAMNGLTQTIALEGAAFGVRCNAICPGPVMTERLEGSIKRQSAVRAIAESELIAEWKAESPMGRFATKEECARVAMFLASDDSSAMTGQALNVTAGVIMH